MGHSDDFKFSIQNNECIEIAGNFGRENFQGISFEIFSMESSLWNPESDTLTLNYITNQMILYHKPSIMGTSELYM